MQADRRMPVARCALQLHLLALGACAQTIDVGQRADGGLAADAGGVAQDARPVGQDADGLDALAGDAAVDAGDAAPADGAAPELRWGPMQLPRMNTIYSVWGRGPGELYAGTGSGVLLGYSTANPNWIEVWHEPGNQSIRLLAGTATKIFACGLTELYVHRGGIEAAPESHAVGSSVNDLWVVSDTEAYLAADQTNGRGGVYRYDGAQVTPMIEVSDGTAFYGVARDDERIYVGSQGAILAYDGALVAETIQWPASIPAGDRPLVAFESFTRIGVRLLAVSSDPRMILERTPSGWAVRYGPSVGDDFHNLYGFSNSLGGLELHAVGSSLDHSPVVHLVDGTGEEVAGLSAYDLWDVWAAEPGLWFASGSLRNSFEGVILRGSLQ